MFYNQPIKKRLSAWEGNLGSVSNQVGIVFVTNEVQFWDVEGALIVLKCQEWQKHRANNLFLARG